MHFNEREDGVNDGDYTEVNGKKNVHMSQAVLGPNPHKMIKLTDARMSSVMEEEMLVQTIYGSGYDLAERANGYLDGYITRQSLGGIKNLGRERFVASNCLVDSGFHGSVCHSEYQEKPWWEAKPEGWRDGRGCDITAVIVRNRENCIGTPRTDGPPSPPLFPRRQPSAGALGARPQRRTRC